MLLPNSLSFKLIRLTIDEKDFFQNIKENKKLLSQPFNYETNNQIKENYRINSLILKNYNGPLKEEMIKSTQNLKHLERIAYNFESAIF